MSRSSLSARRCGSFAWMDETMLLPRAPEEDGARFLGRPWAVVVGANRGPSREPACGRARVDTRSAARDALVLLVVREAVHEGIADLPRAREIATVVAVAPDAATTSAERRVEEAIRAHGKALHAAGERVVVVGLDDEMEVVVLHREFDHAEVVTSSGTEFLRSSRETVDLSFPIRRAISLMVSFFTFSFEIIKRSRDVSCLKHRCAMEKSFRDFSVQRCLRSLHLESEPATPRESPG